MRNHRIGPLLRTLAEPRPTATDAELLGEYVADRSEDAFNALVERHGRLVWAVCRQLAGPDADDAFQATFLVFSRNAARIRKPESLAAWLHGVAYRVSARARRTAHRRAARERAAAVPNVSTAVPDSAWDRALAAVHEEVARLPEALRLPFALCALEGRTVTEAANDVGWKVSTLSARLGRAKDALLARLHARGLSAGAVVAIAISSEAIPRALAQSAIVAAGAKSVSVNIQILTHGVVGMNAQYVKFLAAGVFLAVGLGIGGGAGWLATAGAQAPSRPPSLTPEEKVRQLEAQLERAKRELEDQRAADKGMTAKYPIASTAKWQYAFVPARDLDAEAFVQLLKDHEARGWDYSGQTTLKKEAVWAFRRPIGGQPGTAESKSWGNPSITTPSGNRVGSSSGINDHLLPGTRPPAETTTPQPKGNNPATGQPPKQ